MRVATKATCVDALGGALTGAALRRHLEASVAASQQALGRAVLDVVYLHNASVEVLAAGEALGVLRDVQARGWVGAVGATTYGVEAAVAAVDAGVDVLQVAVNPLDQALVEGVLARCAAAGVGVVARSVFLKGVLTRAPGLLPDFLQPLADAARRVAALCPSTESGGEAAVRFVLGLPGVATLAIGTRGLANLAEVVRWAERGPLPAEEHAALRAAFGMFEHGGLLAPEHRRVWGMRGSDHPPGPLPDRRKGEKRGP